MKFSIFEFADIFAAIAERIGPSTIEIALSVFSSVHITLELIFSKILIRASPMLLIIFELADIFVTIGIEQGPTSTSYVVLEFAYIL